MSNFPSRKKWAMPGARYPGTVLAARKVRTWRMQTAEACAGLLRRSEDRHLVTTPLPIPVTSRFGAPIPVTKTSAFSRSHKEEVKNFLSRKKWAMPGARYPGTVLAAQKSVTCGSDEWRSRRTRRRRRTAVRRQQQGRKTNTFHLRRTVEPARSNQASNAAFGGGRNGSDRRRRSAETAVTQPPQYAEMWNAVTTTNLGGRRARGCTEWPTLPSGLLGSPRRRQRTRPRTRARSTGGGSADDARPPSRSQRRRRCRSGRRQRRRIHIKTLALLSARRGKRRG